MRVLALAILGVTVTTAVLVWACFGIVRDAERMQRDPKFLRRRALLLGTLYVISAAYGVSQVIEGNEPPIALIGLPIAAAFAWTFLKAAANVKPPQP